MISKPLTQMDLPAEAARPGLDSPLFDTRSQLRQLIALLKEAKDADSFQSVMQLGGTLKLAQAVVSNLNGSDPVTMQWDKSHPRVLLSVLLISRHGPFLMPHATQEESELITLAAKFDQLLTCSAWNERPSREESRALSLAWMELLDTFSIWSIKDRKNLLQGLRDDFLTWVKKIGRWQDDHESHAEWEPHVLEYKQKILTKIYQIYGEAAIKDIQAKVAALNEKFPRANLEIETDSERKCCTCSWKAKTTSVPEESKREGPDTGALKLTNIRILHELMMSKEGLSFEGVMQMNGKTGTAISKRNRKVLLAVADLLKAEQKGEKVAMIFEEIFAFIRAALTELAGNNHDYIEELKATDISIGAADWLTDAKAVLEVMLAFCRRCCAPVRDAKCEAICRQLENLSESETPDELAASLTAVFNDFFDLVNDMHSDFCNFRMQILKTKIQGKGIAENYELEAFKKTFPKHPNTERWLRSANVSDPKAVLAEKFLGMLTGGPAALHEQSLPETFYLDQERVRDLQEAILERLQREAIRIYLKGIVSSTEDLEKTIDDIVVQRKLELIPVKSLAEQSQIEAALANVRRLLDQAPEKDKVFSLLKQRLCMTLKNRLIRPDNAVPVGEFEQKIALLIEPIRRLFEYNKACYGEIYDQILSSTKSS